MARQIIGDRIAYRLSDADKERLLKFCSDQHMTIAEVSRTAVKAYLDRFDRDLLIDSFIDQSEGSQYGQLMQCLQNFMFEVDTIQRASNE